MKHTIIEPIRKRYSTVIFDHRPVENEKLQRIFEAARWSASSFNEQPWRFVIFDRNNEERFNAALSTLAEFNRSWAKNAPLLVVAVAKENFSHNNKPNRHSWYDVGQAVSALSIQAAAEDIYLRQMAGFDAAAVTDLLGLPEGYRPVAVMALGYRGAVETAEDELQKRERSVRSRMEISEFIFQNGWEKAASFAEMTGELVV